MGILDDAIREHLELKRQHGADESEVEGLEAEAFGPADRPDATGSGLEEGAHSDDAEALTQVISPGSSVTAPAGEGDQLDKVFAGTGQTEESPAPDPYEEPSFEEHEVPATGDATDDVEPTDGEPEVPEAAAPDAGPTQVETAADPVVEAPGAPPEASAEPEAEQGDAGDALEMERQHLAGQPTEHYDVDAAIAEEDEIDLLSESSLSDELDRALEGSGDEASPATREPEPEPEHEFEPETVSAPEPEEIPEPQPDPEGDDAAPDPELATGEAVEEEQHDLEEAEFFDQDDPLEGTPDFLEETPEHDRLWFEQKEPKDFDFGD